MSDDESSKNEALTELVKTIGGPLYKDAIQPWAKCIGALAAVVRIPSTSIISWLKVASKRLDPKRIAPPPKALAAPILQALPSADEEPELLDRSLELLAKSMDREDRACVHPAYGHVLSSLSPDEARLLEGFRENNPIVWAEYSVSQGEVSTSQGGSIPVIGMYTFVTMGSHQMIRQPESFRLYYDNMTRLGILEPRSAFSASTGIPSKSLEILDQSATAWFTENHNAVPKRGRASTDYRSDFGEGFVEACLRANPPKEGDYGPHCYGPV